VEHDHDKKMRGMNDATKKFVEELYAKGIKKPICIKDNIMVNLQTRPSLDEPSILQIKYYLKKLKNNME
jgi:hypothetical protein